MTSCTRGGRWAGMMPIPREGPVGQGWAGGRTKSPRVMEEWTLHTQTWRQVLLGLSPTCTENNPSPTDPIPPVPVEGDPSKPPSLPVVPLMVPTLMTLVFVAMFQTYGSLTIPGEDVIEGGQWCRVQTLMQGIPKGMPLPSPFPDLLAFVQRESQSPDVRPGSIFPKWIGLVSPGLGVQYSPISGGSQCLWFPGSNISSLPSEF